MDRETAKAYVDAAQEEMLTLNPNELGVFTNKKGGLSTTPEYVQDKLGAAMRKRNTNPFKDMLPSSGSPSGINTSSAGLQASSAGGTIR
ncbi:MAG TPA: hypothetical protein VEY30_00090 [Myxococcaceae bacterium]|nr:hypothetical protein [Myxococcaceae bacterium]